MKKEELQKCVRILEDKGLLDYGRFIDRKILEIMFQCTDIQSWEFLGPYLSLKEHLESEGYLCTSEGLEPGNLRILDAGEMVLKGDIIMNNLKKKFKKLEKCFLSAKTEEFSSLEYRKYLHALNKISANVHALKSPLNSF